MQCEKCWAEIYREYDCPKCDAGPMCNVCSDNHYCDGSEEEHVEV